MTEQVKHEALEFAARLRKNHPEIMSAEPDEDDSGVYLSILLEPDKDIDITLECPLNWQRETLPIGLNRMENRASFMRVNRIGNSNA